MAMCLKEKGSDYCEKCDVLRPKNINSEMFYILVILVTFISSTVIIVTVVLVISLSDTNSRNDNQKWHPPGA